MSRTIKFGTCPCPANHPKSKSIICIIDYFYGKSTVSLCGLFSICMIDWSTDQCIWYWFKSTNLIILIFDNYYKMEILPAVLGRNEII